VASRSCDRPARSLIFAGKPDQACIHGMACRPGGERDRERTRSREVLAIEDRHVASASNAIIGFAALAPRPAASLLLLQGADRLNLFAARCCRGHRLVLPPPLRRIFTTHSSPRRFPQSPNYKRQIWHDLDGLIHKKKLSAENRNPRPQCRNADKAGLVPRFRSSQALAAPLMRT
jgi:hypothetical protein